MYKLPPFASLRAFEAAARHMSFKNAALELGLTPTAISHQIKQLECLSGQVLFTRHARRVELTPQGQTFAKGIGPAIEAMGAAFEKLSAGVSRKTVTLGAGPIFAARWLVPRLADFWDAHPGIDLWLHHSPLPVWRQMERFDLAIAWGRGDWPGLDCTPILRIDVTPVLAPALADSHGAPRTAKDLLRLPLLHHRDREGWRQWLETAGVAVPDILPGTVFEDANVLLQAALSGRGAALGIVQFVGDELGAGRLTRPFPLQVDPGDAYFLIHRPNAPASQAVAAAKDWLLKAQSDAALRPHPCHA